jgi:hypothetical protein
MKRHTIRLPRLTLDDLLQRAGEHRQRGQAVDDLMNRRRNVTSEAEAEIARVLADDSPAAKAYRLLGRTQHRADAKQMVAEKLPLVEPHLSRALFEGRHHHGQLQQALEEFEAAERQPPGMEDAVLSLTGQPGWSVDQLLMGSLLEQVTLANVRNELRSAPPSRRAVMYQEAMVSPFDPVNSVLIRVLERERIPYPDNATSPEEVAAAAQLGRLIAETQAARVPDTSEVRAVLEKVGGVLRRAELSGVQPVNPEHPTVPEPEPLPASAAAGE